jgi:DNA-binding NtrC family response regulator
MKLNILIFDQEQGLRELLRIYLKQHGHEVTTFSEPTMCSLYRNLMDEHCCCPQEHPCADAIFIDYKTRNINAFDFLKLQRRRGCKALDANKAVMSTNLTKALTDAIEEFGCHHIKKPFLLGEIKSWTEDCVARLAVQRSSVSTQGDY